VIRVLIAEDHAVVRKGLAELVGGADDIEVVGAAADGDEAVELATELEPDVVLMDLSMPGMDGIEATRAVVGKLPGTRVVALTAFSDRRRVLEALDAGAIGYLLKDVEPADLFVAVRAAARGESPLAPKAASALVSERTERRAPELSPREVEVLSLVAAGLPNKLIARRLEIAEKTVKAHLTSVFAAIGVSDRTQAALWARDHGIERPAEGA
jgi:DNA-binding NarL/FixJ family response regulator